jgi:hypothetical protein
MSEAQDRISLLAEQGMVLARLQSLPAAAQLTRRSLKARARMLADALMKIPELPADDAAGLETGLTNRRHATT